MKNALVILLVFFSTSLFATTWQIKNVQEFANALNKAQKGDTIQVLSGQYLAHDLQITKPLVIIGKGYPVFDGEYKGEIFTIRSSDVVISGLQFEHVGESNIQDWAAIKVVESTNVSIIDNRLIDCYFGIYLSASTNCIIINNYIKGTPKNEQGTGNGFHSWNCDSLTVSNNRVTGHRDGFYFEFVTNSMVTNNVSVQNIRYGLHFMFSHNNSYSYNIFEENGAGVAVMYTKNVTMTHNVFKNNWGGSSYGILLKDITDSEIDHNYFDFNTVGIFMEGCNRLKFTNNELHRNGIALRIQSNCEDNELNNNNFIGNTFDIGTSGMMTANSLSGNYWDKYEGYDLDRDGTGDLSYRPVSLFSILIERMPQVMMLLRSFTATLLDKIEKVLPSLTPENLMDYSPRMKPNLLGEEPLNQEFIL